MIVRYLPHSARRLMTQAITQAYLWLLVAVLALACAYAIASTPVASHASAPGRAPLMDTCAGSHVPC